MGAVLQLPGRVAEPWPAGLGTLRGRTATAIAALTPDADAPLDRVRAASRPRRRAVLLLGAEGTGLTAEALAAGRRARPHPDRPPASTRST